MDITLQTNRFTQSLAMATLRLKSWKLDVNMPTAPKFVLVGAPHTSGMDLFYALMLAHGTGIKMNWIGKDSLFRWPLGGPMRWLGGIPVQRQSRQNFVQQVVDIFNRLERLVIAIAPEKHHAAKQITGKPAFITSPRAPVCPSPWGSSIIKIRSLA